jgi:hypothetical protein
MNPREIIGWCLAVAVTACLCAFLLVLAGSIQINGG